MDDLYRIAKPTTYQEPNPLLKNALELALDEQKRLRAENAQLRRELEGERKLNTVIEIGMEMEAGLHDRD